MRIINQLETDFETLLNDFSTFDELLKLIKIEDWGICDYSLRKEMLLFICYSLKLTDLILRISKSFILFINSNSAF